MKNLFTLGLLFAYFTVLGQEKIIINEEMVAIDGTSRNSLTVMLVGSTTDEAKKAWKKQLKNLKGKVNDKTFIFCDDCRLKEMGENTFDVYSIVEEATEKGVKLVAAFDLGGAYLSTAAHPEKYPAAEKFLYDFAVEQAKTVVATEIEASQRMLKELEKALAGLQKEKADHEADIKAAEKKIEASKAEIEKNTGNQTIKKTEIEEMKSAIMNLEVKLKNVK